MTDLLTTDPLFLELQAHNSGLYGLHLNLRYFEEERTSGGNPWPALNWLPGIMKQRMIEDIEERLIRDIRELEQEIRR